MGIAITLTIPTPRRKRATSRHHRRQQQQQHHHDPSPSPHSGSKHERPRRPRRIPKVPACIPCISLRVHRTGSHVSPDPSSVTTSSSSTTIPNPDVPRPSPTATISSPPLSQGKDQQKDDNKQVEENVDIKQVPIQTPSPIVLPTPPIVLPTPLSPDSPQPQPQSQPQPAVISPPTPPPPPPMTLPRSPSQHSTSSRNQSNPQPNHPNTSPPSSNHPQSPHQAAVDATHRITNISNNNDLFTDTSRVAAIASITASATAAAVTAAFRTLCPDLLLPMSSSSNPIRDNEQSNTITQNNPTRWQRTNPCTSPNNQFSVSRWRASNQVISDNQDNQENPENPVEVAQRSGLAIFMNDPRNGAFIEIAMRGPNRQAATEVSSRSSTSASSSHAASTVIPESDDDAPADQDNEPERSVSRNSSYSNLTENENPKLYMQRTRKESPNKCVEKGLDTLMRKEMYNNDVITFVVQELEEVLSSTANSEVGSSSPKVDPPLRVRAHHDLALYFKNDEKPNREKVMHHCRTGLVCLPGCENKLPEQAAEMHCLYAEELAKDVPANQSLLRDVIEHINSAKAALFVEPNPQLSYRIALVTGQVYATRWDEPICDNLVAAYEAYHSALEIIKFGEEDRRDEYLRIGCFCVDFILRFLRHQRQVRNNPKSPCYNSETTACRKDLSLSPVLPHFNIEYALEFANKLRTVLNQCIDAEDESRDNYTVAEFKHGTNLSAIHECLARCYLERSEQNETNAARDLGKACHHLRRALATHHEQKDLAMQRYSFLHDLLREIEQKQEQVGRVTSGSSTNESEDANSVASFESSVKDTRGESIDKKDDEDKQEDKKDDTESTKEKEVDEIIQSEEVENINDEPTEPTEPTEPIAEPQPQSSPGSEASIES